MKWMRFLPKDVCNFLFFVSMFFFIIFLFSSCGIEKKNMSWSEQFTSIEQTRFMVLSGVSTVFFGVTSLLRMEM